MFHFESKVRKKPTSQLKAVQRQESPLPHRIVSLFVLFRPSTNGMRPARLREGKLLRLGCQSECQSHSEPPARPHRHTHSSVQPSIWAPLWPSRVDTYNCDTELFVKVCLQNYGTERVLFLKGCKTKFNCAEETTTNLLTGETTRGTVSEAPSILLSNDSPTFTTLQTIGTSVNMYRVILYISQWGYLADFQSLM